MNYKVQYEKNTWENTRAPKTKSRAINLLILIVSFSIAIHLLLPDISSRLFREESEAFSKALIVAKTSEIDHWEDKLVAFCKAILHVYEDSNSI